MLHQQQSLLLHAPRQVAWVEAALPPLGPHDLLLRTRAGAISMGTELPAYQGRSRSHVLPTYPTMTGYESLADVVACGAAVHDIAAGDRVVAFYGHRTAAVVPAARVVPVPADIPDARALLLILACDTARGVTRVSPQSTDRVLITGAGTIGLLALFNLRARGVQHIDVMEPLGPRRTMARDWGAGRTIDPASEHPASSHYQVGFECSSCDAAFHLLQDALVPQGQVCILADGNVEPLTLSPAFHVKELTVVGSSDGLDYREYATWYWEVVRQTQVPLERLFEWTVAAETLPDVFADLAQGRVQPLKVLIQYSDG